MAVYLTGDLHGGHDMDKLRPESWPSGRSLACDDFLIVCGDFGFPWDLSEVQGRDVAWLESQPWTTLFVDGNHERFDYWDERPCEPWRGGRVQRLRPGSSILRLMRGEVFEIDGSTYFTMGGATSVDREWRIEGVSWWPQELPDEGDFARADAALAARGWQADYVITHACSTRMLPRALYPDSEYRHPDRDRLTDYLNMLEDRLKFRHWYCGHYHVDRDIDGRHTVLYQEIVPAGAGVGGGRAAGQRVHVKECPSGAMRAPKNPVGYTYAELAGFLGCDVRKIRAAMSGQTVGIDEATGEVLVYPHDARRVARELVRGHGGGEAFLGGCKV